MKLTMIALGLTSCLAMACATQSPASAPRATHEDAAILSTTTATAGGVAITDQMIGRSRGTMALSKTATSSSYAYSMLSPVRIGGGFGSGADRVYKFLNSLRGPNGEEVSYDRIGTCCSFDTPNSPFDGKGLLEVYEISYPGIDHRRRIYFDWYDDGEVMIPMGLTAGK